MQGMALMRSRKERGLTQEETAKLLGVSQPFLSQMESGQRPIQEAVAKRAFELLPEPMLLPLNPDRREDDAESPEALIAWVRTAPVIWFSHSTAPHRVIYPISCGKFDSQMRSA
jgi:transcriptional regulator with XRE-family HTH domain